MVRALVEEDQELTKPRILVIEDDTRIRDMLQRLLEQEGFAVEAAADGQEGLEKAANRAPALIVLDLHLPVMDGAGVVAGLRSSDGHAPPILLVTADDRPAERARSLGAYAYLRKPFELDDLIAEVRRGLQSRSER